MSNETAVAAEQQVLGAILTNNEAFDQVSDMLTEEFFYDPVHARIFAQCRGRIGKGHIASPVALQTSMEGDEGLKELGGGRYLVRLASMAVSVRTVRETAGIVIDLAARRAIEALTREGREAIASGVDTSDVKMRLLHALEALPEVTGREASRSIAAAMTDAVREAQGAFDGTRSFLKTGIRALDAILKGLAPGDLLLLGGATSAGKTSAALEIATNIAMSGGKGVAFVSLEMSEAQLVTRMAAARSRVSYSDLRDPAAMKPEDFERWINGGRELVHAAMRIIPRHVRDIPAIHSAVRRAAREMGEGAPLSCVVIDYLQLVRAPGARPIDQMREVSIQTKHMAAMLGVPVIGLVQLSRDIGYRDDKRPKLSDIKETGQFENDADQAVFCHRESYWLEREGPKLNKEGQITDAARAEFAADLQACRNKMELIVRKNRHGRLATAEVGFHPASNRFWDLQEDQEEMAF
jgi:replicative DNA helicase